MLKRLIYALVGVVGLALIGLAIASATVWRADDVLRASATADQAIVVTDPGVLEMAGDPVTVTATVPDGGHVVLAIGRDTDVEGWVGTDAHQRVSGLVSWHALALTSAPRPGTASPGEATAPAPDEATGSASVAPDEAATATAVPDAAASDMWVARAAGEGSAELTWQAQPGRWSLLVVGSAADGAAAPPTLELAWPRTVTTPYLVPGSVVGAVLALLALLLLGRDVRRGHHGPAEWTPVLTEPVPVLTATGAQRALTRRQLREMRVLAEAGHRVELPVDEPAAAAATDRVPPAAAAADPVAARAGAGPATRGEVRPDEVGPDEVRSHEVRPDEVEPDEVEPDEAPAGTGRQIPFLGRRSLRRRQAAPRLETSAAGTTASLPPVADEPRVSSPAPGNRFADRPATVPAGSPAPARPAWAPLRGAAGESVRPGGVPGIEPSGTPRTAAEAPATTPASATSVGSAPATGSSAPTTPGPVPSGEVVHEPAWLRTAVDDAHRRDARERRASAPAAPTDAPVSDAPLAAPPTPTQIPAGRPGGGRPGWEPRSRRAVRREASGDGPERSAKGDGPPAEPPVPEPDRTAAEQPEASRADAWRRAWGLPSLDTEEGEK